VDDYVTIASANKLNFSGADDFTIEMWVKSDGMGGYLYDKTPDNPSFDMLGIWTEILSDGTVVFNLGKEGTTWENLNTTTNVVQVNRWTHLAFEKDGSTSRIYVDGTMTSSTTLSTSLSAIQNTFPANLGRERRNNLGHFGGQMDEIRVSNIARYGGSNFIPPASYVSDGSTVLHYDMNMGTGQTITDNSASPATGTLGLNALTAGDINDPLWALRTTNTLDDGSIGSLRWAITEANLDTDKDYIDFSIDAAGVQTIIPISSLPPITEQILIDGYSQLGSSKNTQNSGSNAILNIQINGSSAGNVEGLQINAPNSEIYGLIINGYSGVSLDKSGIKFTTNADNSIVAGCWIGLDATLNAVPNRVGIGIDAGADNLIIGLPTPQGRNVISGNSFYGILANNANNVTIQNNYVGLAPDGSTAKANLAGILPALRNSLIGGSGLLEGNVFSGNSISGINLASNAGSPFNTRIFGNYIGVAADGITARGNGVYGINYQTTNLNNMQIGGINSGEGNIIANHGSHGIAMGSSGSTGNSIRGNSIFANTGLGIDLGLNGITANDPNDADIGNNNLQNFPVITSAQLSGTVINVAFSVDATIINSAYGTTGLKVDFYKSDFTRQGKEYLGTINYPAASAQTVLTGFSVPVGSVVVGDYILATATDDNGNTSEFSDEFFLAGTYYSNDVTSGGNWNIPSSWAIGSHSGTTSSIVPPAGATVIIKNGHTITANIPISPSSITLAGTLDLGNLSHTLTTTDIVNSGGTGRLKIGGSLSATSIGTVAASSSFFTTPTNVVEFYGGNILTRDYPTIEVSGGGTISSSVDFTILGNLKSIAGTNFSSTAKVIFSNSGTLPHLIEAVSGTQITFKDVDINGNTTVATPISVLVTIKGVLSINTSATLINNSNNLQIDGSVSPLTSRLTGAGNFVAGNGSVLYYQTDNDITLTGTFNVNANPNEVFYGAGSSVFATTYRDLIFDNNTGGARTLNGTVNAQYIEFRNSADLTLAGGAVLNQTDAARSFSMTGAGTLNFGTSASATVTIAGDLVANNGGTINMSNPASLHILNLNGVNNTLSNLITLTNTNATVVYGGLNQNVFSSTEYQILEIAGGGTKILQGVTTVNNQLKLTAGVLDIGTNDLTIGQTATIVNGLGNGTAIGDFSASNFIRTGGGLLKKEIAAIPFNFVFPIGTPSSPTDKYTPMEATITSATISATPAILSVKASTGDATALVNPALALNKFWNTYTTNLSAITGTAKFYYALDDSEVRGVNDVNYLDAVRSGSTWITGNTANVNTTTNEIMFSSVSDWNNKEWTAGEFVAFIPTYYSISSGDWNNIATWSFSSGGSPVAVGDLPIPSGANVVIERGFTVTANANNQLDGTNITIGTTNGAGTLDLGVTTHGTVSSITSTASVATQAGTIRLSAGNNLTVMSNTFSTNNFAKIEYNGGTFAIPATFAGQDYPNLVILAGVKTLAGNTTVSQNLQIDNTATLDPLSFNFTVNGTTTINNGGIFTENNLLGNNTFTGLVSNSGTFGSGSTNQSPTSFGGGIQNLTGATFSMSSNSPVYLTGVGATVTNSSANLMFLGGNGGLFVAAPTTLAGTGAILPASAIGTVTIASGVTLTNTNTNLVQLRTFTPASTTSTFVNATNAVLQYDGQREPMFDGTSVTGVFNVSATGNKVIYAMATTGVTQNVRATIYHHLQINLNGTDAKILQGNITVNGDLLITNATLNANNFNIDLKGNWTNSFTNGFTAGTGTVTLNGTTTLQIVGGLQSTTFNNLVIDNINHIRIDRSAIVSNGLTLTNGKVILNNTDLTYNGTEAALIGASATRYVQTKTLATSGYFIRTNNLSSGSNLFPVGTDTEGYAPITMNYGSTPPAIPHQVKAVTASTLPTNVGSVKVAWDIIKNSASNNPTLTFDWQVLGNQSGLINTSSFLYTATSPFTAWTPTTASWTTGTTLSGYTLPLLATANRHAIVTSSSDYYTLDNAVWSNATTKWSIDGTTPCLCFPNNVPNTTLHIRHNTVLDNASRLGTTNTVIVENANTSFDLGTIIPTNTFVLNTDNVATTGQVLIVANTGITQVSAGTFMDNPFSTINYNGGTFTIPELVGTKEYQNLLISAGTKTMNLTANRNLKGQLNIAANFTLTGTGVLNSVLTTTNAILYSGTGSLTLGTATAKLLVNGTFTNTTTGGTLTSLTSSLEFNNSASAIYIHARNGGIIPMAAWGANSTTLVTGNTNAVITSGFGQTFGNFTWNCNGQIAFQTIGADMTVLNTFSLLNTNNESLILTSTVNTLTTKHFIQNPATTKNARFFLAAANGAVGNLIISGDFNNGITPAGTSVFALLSGTTSVGNITFNGSGSNQIFNPPSLTKTSTQALNLTVNKGAATEKVIFKPTTLNLGGTTYSTLTVQQGIFSLGEVTPQNFTIDNLTGVGTLEIVGANHNFTLSGNNTVSFAGTLTTDTNPSTITYNGVAQNVFGSPNYRNLVIGGSLSKNLQANSTINNNLTINGTAAFSLGANTVNLKGHLTRSSGVFAQGTSNFIMDGGGLAQIITGGITFHNLEVANTNGISLALTTPIVVSNSLTLTNGKITIGNNNLTLSNVIVANQILGTPSSTNYIATTGTIGSLIRGTGGSNLLFPIGSAAQYQPVILEMAAASSSVRFGSPTLIGSSVGSWFIDNGTTSSVVTLSPQGVGLTPSSAIFQRTSAWTLLPTTFSSPDYKTTNPVAFASAAKEFAIINDFVEINLQGNSTDIASGSTTTNTTDDTDFGSVLECGINTIDKTFTIQNTGTAVLTISGITLSGTNAVDFTLGTIPTSVAVGGSETFTITFDPPTTGNRTATVSIANDDSDENPYTFDISGNGLADTENPTITALSNVSRNADNGVCNFTNTTGATNIPNGIANDNCSIASYSYILSGATSGTVSDLSSQVFNVGITTVTWTARDGSNNVSVSSNFTVTILDTQVPTLNTPLPTNVSVLPNRECTFYNINIQNPFYIPDGTASDNCSVASYEYVLTGSTNQTVTTLENQVFNEGTTTITWKAIDINGNSSSSSIFTVTVIDSQQPPVLTPMPNFTKNTDQTNCFYTNTTTRTSTSIPNGTASDNCGVASYRYLLSGATLADVTSLQGVRFNTGITTVSWTATDRNGNTSLPNQFTVTILDAQNPTIQAPQNITRTTNLYSCTSTRDNLNIGTPIVSDNCLFRVFNNAPTEFPIGETVVIWTALDSAGNRATANQIVTIEEQYYVIPSDSLILVQIYNEMGGASWSTTWNLNAPVSTWNGISIRCGRVASINLSGNNLTGTLPASVLNLARRTQNDFSLNISRNRLSFESAEDFVGAIPNFTYSPQGKIYASRTEVIRQSQSITFNSQTQGNFNNYQWYKDQNPIAGATNLNYTITNAVPSDAGVYICRVTNTVATQLTLERNPITLQVEGFVNPTDSLALVEIFVQTGGSTSWTEVWDLTQPVSTWQGVTLSGSKLRELDLSSRNMIGTLPNVFDAELFSELRYLSFFNNNLEGQIPSTIGAITTLTYLDLDKNNFEGSVPTSFGGLVNLQALWLSRNNLTILPNEIGNLRSLKTFYLNDNKFNQLPETIGNLTELLVLNVSNNELTGLPNSITNLRKLIQFYANRNYIATIPTGIQNLVDLTVFEINANNLTALPNGFLQLSTLSSFKVSENKLEFDDLLPYSNQNYSVFQYAPQAPINEEEDILATLNSSVSFTIQTQGNGNNYQWFRNGNSVATTQTLTINRVGTNDVGIYTAQITNPSLPDLILQRRSITLNVECQSGLSLEIKQPTQTVFCESQPFGLKLEIDNQFVNASQIRWRKDGVVLAFASERTYTVTIAGKYTVEILSVDGCTLLSDEVEITVLPQPEINIILTTENVLTSTLNSQEPVTYQWLKDGNPIEEGFERTYTPTETGEYSLLVLTQSGCSSVSETIIFTQTITGIEEPKELRNLAIFPNPNNGNFFIDFGINIPNGEPIFTLIDAIGKKLVLKTERISTTRYKVNTTNLTGGMYYIQIQTKDGLVFRKFVIEE
jgi:hypothetical protein